MTRYQLNRTYVNKLIKTKHYSNLSDFAETHHLNRATLNNYFEGKGPFAEPFYRLSAILNVDPLSLLIKQSQSEIAPIVDLAQQLLDDSKDLAIVLIGSRAKGDHKKYSDWDLGVLAKSPGLSTDRFLQLKGRLSDLAEDFPQFVDLVNLNQAPLWFLEALEYDPVFVTGQESLYHYFLGVLHGIKKK